LPPDQQGKRTVVPLVNGSFSDWLTDTVTEALALIELPELDIFGAEPTQEAPPGGAR